MPEPDPSAPHATNPTDCAPPGGGPRERVKAFERAFRDGPRLRIEDCLPPAGTDARVLLLELVHAELELRVRAGEPARVREYLARFPDLAVPADVADLLATEANARAAAGEVLDRAEYDDAYPDFPAQVAAVFARRAAAAAAIPGYELLERVGKGGMGVVYRARDLTLGRVVAVKTILRAEHATPAERERFLREARAAAVLQHPNIVQVFEIGEAAGLPYFTMEFVPGGTLADRVRDTLMPPREAAAVVEQVARGVAFAHAHGVVHRDLKPGNVLMAGGAGRDSKPPAGPRSPAAGTGEHRTPLAVTPKIADFGLAKLADAAAGLTASGDFLGTPEYMAPEQARHSKSAGAAADVWAVGAILYRLLAGRPPFQGGDWAETLRLTQTADPVPPRQVQPGVPRDLETVCLKCLEKEPARRYPTAAALADDLLRFLAGEPITARPVSWPERAAKWTRRHPTGATAVAAAAAVAVTLAATTVLLAAANGRLERAKATVEENTAFTERAVDEVIDLAADADDAERLTAEPTRTDRQTELLRRGVAFYEDLLRRSETDPRLLAKQGALHLRLGLLRAQDEQPAAAAEACGRAAAAFRERLAVAPDDRAARTGLGSALHRVGNAHLHRAPAGGPGAAEAAASYRDALTVRESLAADGTDHDRVDLAVTHTNLATLHAKTGDAAGARTGFDAAVRLLDPICADARPPTGPADALVRALRARSRVRYNRSRSADAAAALADLEGARADLTRLAAHDPVRYEDQDLVTVAEETANRLFRARRFADARREYLAAAARCRVLAGRDYGVLAHRVRQAELTLLAAVADAAAIGAGGGSAYAEGAAADAAALLRAEAENGRTRYAWRLAKTAAHAHSLRCEFEAAVEVAKARLRLPGGAGPDSTRAWHLRRLVFQAIDHPTGVHSAVAAVVADPGAVTPYEWGLAAAALVIAADEPTVAGRLTESDRRLPRDYWRRAAPVPDLLREELMLLDLKVVDDLLGLNVTAAR